ncbi:MAG: head maturation protease, ClpP-related [Bacteroidota bacterium]
MSYKIYLYDTDTDCIGSGNLSSSYLQYQLETAAGRDVDVHISSAGGSAFDAIAIYDLLKKYPGNVTTYIDALAASAASIVAMAGKKIIMSKYALLMIHKPMVGSGGNADELLKDVQLLNVVQSRLAQIYMDKTGLDSVTVNSLINAVTWLSADQALDLGFIDEVEDYTIDITNHAIIKNYTNTAPVFYQRYINKILNKNSNMNIENKELIEKNTSVLAQIMNFFKKVINQQTITDKGTLHHAGYLEEGATIYQDEEMTTPAITDTYTTAEGKKIDIKSGQVEKVTPCTDDEDDDLPEDQLKSAKAAGVQNRVSEIRAKLRAQTQLLNEAKAALETANSQLKKTREEVRNEIKSDFTPEGSKRSNKAKTETSPFFAPQTTLAQNAVKRAVAK